MLDFVFDLYILLDRLFRAHLIQNRIIQSHYVASGHCCSRPFPNQLVLQNVSLSLDSSHFFQFIIKLAELFFLHMKRDAWNLHICAIGRMLFDYRLILNEFIFLFRIFILFLFVFKWVRIVLVVDIHFTSFNTSF